MVYLKSYLPSKQILNLFKIQYLCCTVLTVINKNKSENLGKHMRERDGILNFMQHFNAEW